MTKIPAVPRIHRYRALAPLRSLRAAIAAAAPDLVIPCDDLATAHLHQLYRWPGRAAGTGEAVRALLERSLGRPASFAMARARTNFITWARTLGIRVPRTGVMRSPGELAEWLVTNAAPAVLKTDGSYGGRGVRIVHTVDEAHRAWRELNSPPSPARAVKRALVNRDRNYLLPSVARTRPVVNAQAFVAGRDANASVACWKGTIVASITARVVQTLDQHGPASVVEAIEHPDISASVAKVVGALGLSGLLGFDFVVEEQTGDAYLIEMNPRATQICHLSLGVDRDLPAALRAALTGEAVRATPRVFDRDVIALFPQEWLRDPASPFLATAFHDVPWDQPGLIRACLREANIDRTWSKIMSRIPAAVSRRKGSSQLPEADPQFVRRQHAGEPT